MMFATGYFLYGETILALEVSALALVSSLGLFYYWKKLRNTEI
jgi:dimeric dUTPase (all-alpha-NTP-PPase superfamily)